MAKLVCQSGPSAGHEYPLGKDVISMGRQSSCDVQILDTMSSRTHCQIRKDGKLFTLVDLGSRNGTHLNDKKVTERQLNFGDRIRIGEVEYLFTKESGDVELKDLLSKYEIQEKLGEGGMGIVYKAIQRSMARTVALKILSPKYASKKRFVDQFIREARAAGTLNHPNIIQVHDVGTENGIHYFSMEYVDGPTCMQVLKQNGAFPLAEALEIVRQAAKALEYAHSQRLIHQDIKPDNIMVSQSNAIKVADLGISKTFDEAESEDQPKRVMGTPHYMAPEAALGKKIDHRVDIYSLGATLYHLLSGKPPFAGTSATDVLKAHVMDPLPAIRDLNPEVPDEVAALIEKMTAKKVEERIASAAEVASEIKRMQAKLGLSSERIATGETMILQRLAKGSTSGAQQTPVEHTTGNRPTRSAPLPAQNAGTTNVRVRTSEHDTGGGWLRKFFGLGIIVVLGAAVWHFLPKQAPLPNTQPRPSGGQSEQPENPVANPKVPTPTTTKVDDNQIAEQLTSLENQVSSGSGDLGTILKDLDRISTLNLSDSNRKQSDALHAKVRQLIDSKRLKNSSQAYYDLNTEVRKLAEERNYDMAINRINAFPDKSDADTVAKLNGLRDEMTKARDAYLGALHQRIDTLRDQKNTRALRELRDQLPPALLGTAIEDDIKKALGQLDAENQAKYQGILKDVAGELVRWNIPRVDEQYDAYRKDMGDTTSGKQFDTFHDTAAKLGDLVNALSSALSNDRTPRYHGMLGNFKDPDLIGADEKGVHLQTLDGAKIVVRWQALNAEELSSIVGMSLKEKAKDYASALQQLSDARAFSQK